MNWSWVVKLLVKYVENHPDEIEQLISAGVQALIHNIKNPSPSTPTTPTS